MRMAGLCQFYWRTCYILIFFFTVLVVHPHHVHPVTTVLTLLSYGTMLPCCAESAVKHQPTDRPLQFIAVILMWLVRSFVLCCGTRRVVIDLSLLMMCLRDRLCEDDDRESWDHFATGIYHQLSVITTQSSTPVTPVMSSTPVTPPQVSITNYLLSQLSLILPLRLVLLLLIIIVTIIRPRSWRCIDVTFAF